MEDDIEVLKNPHLIALAINDLDKLVGKDDWDILFTDKDFMGKIEAKLPTHVFRTTRFYASGCQQISGKKTL